MIIYICTSEILKTGFSVHNIYLYLPWQVENTKWILCCQNGVKCAVFKISDVQNVFKISDVQNVFKISDTKCIFFYLIWYLLNYY